MVEILDRMRSEELAALLLAIYTEKKNHYLSNQYGYSKQKSLLLSSSYFPDSHKWLQIRKYNSDEKRLNCMPTKDRSNDKQDFLQAECQLTLAIESHYLCCLQVLPTIRQLQHG